MKPKSLVQSIDKENDRLMEIGVEEPAYAPSSSLVRQATIIRFSSLRTISIKRNKISVAHSNYMKIASEVLFGSRVFVLLKGAFGDSLDFV